MLGRGKLRIIGIRMFRGMMLGILQVSILSYDGGVLYVDLVSLW